MGAFLFFSFVVVVVVVVVDKKQTNKKPKPSFANKEMNERVNGWITATKTTNRCRRAAGVDLDGRWRGAQDFE